MHHTYVLAFPWDQESLAMNNIVVTFCVLCVVYYTLHRW